MIATDTLKAGTLVRNTKTGKVWSIIRCAEVTDGDPSYRVEDLRAGKRFGKVRTLRGSQLEVVGGGEL